MNFYSKRQETTFICKDKPLRFTFDGVGYVGFRGDTLASALLGSGVRLVGRSFKYHRPRGVLTAGSEEPNALVELRSGGRKEPNTKATSVELFEGLEAKSQNRFFSLSWDLMSVNNLLSSFFGAGFYYKTFMWPKTFWEKFYEPAIRRTAGLGSLSRLEDQDTYEQRFCHTDVLVVGSGLAGLSAALSASISGARVILCEKDFEFGGRMLSDPQFSNQDVRLSLLHELNQRDNVTLMKRTLLFAVYDEGNFAALEQYRDHEPNCGFDGEPRQILWSITARRMVVASGGLERPLVFGNNDLPGVMLAGSVRTYVQRFGVRVGERIVVATNHDDGWQTVATLLQAGITVEGVVDSRNLDDITVDATLLAQIQTAGIKIFDESYIGCAFGGKFGVDSVDIYHVSGKKTTVYTDCVAMSGGWDSAVGLACQHGEKPIWNEEKRMFLPPKKLPQGMTMAGFVAGEFRAKDVMENGNLAGFEAAKVTDREKTDKQACKALSFPFEGVGVGESLHGGDKGGKAFIDFQHDVSLSDVALAHREGYISVEHLKRYTTLGMATDQGKLSNVNGLLEMARLTGKSIQETGTTMFRSPYEPVAIGAFAGTARGKHYRPYRLTPSHDWACENGAHMLEVGVWQRANWYAREGESTWRQSVDREVLATRNGVGICDVTTLGKIEVFGKDAPEFLHKIYANPFLKLAIGKARYGLMLREDGLIMDDGTTSRLAEDHFIMTTTTANAGPVMQHLEFASQVLWSDLDVHLFSISDAWAQFSIAGPNARTLLERLLDSKEDIRNENFPFMAAGSVLLKGGVRARLFRISFSGELAFEIALPFYYGDSFIRHAVRLGKDLGVVIYGTEALGVMRIEKGHVAGPELNGTTTIKDLGLGAFASQKKDYIGRVMSEREGLCHRDRWRIIGVKALDRAELNAGGHLFLRGTPFDAAHDLGHLTSVCYSPMLKAHIGLALVRNKDASSDGSVLEIFDPVRGITGGVFVEVCHPVFYDKEGKRLLA